MKLLPEIYLWKSRNGSNFGSHAPLDRDPGIFLGILQHCKIGLFILAHISVRKTRDLSLDVEVPIKKFRKSSGSGLRIRIESASAEFCAFRVLAVINIAT